MSFLKQEDSLFYQVAKGGIWIFALRVAEKSFGLVRLVILARLLAPDDFGLFGIALLGISILETFSQTGFQAALVQKKEDIYSYLDTAWTVSVGRGIILFVLLFLFAPYVASFFNSPDALLIIQVIGASILLGGFTNIGVVYFQKDLEFNKQFIYQLTSTLTDFVVTVSAALILRNVWALVLGLLAGEVVRLFMSHLLHPYRPHFSFDSEKFKELFGFGKWMLGSSILIFLITQGDDILVGKVLGVTALGFYQVAYRISSIPTTEITHVISRVTFPAYSKMGDNLPRLRESYLRVLQITAFLSFPIAGLIFVLAPDFTEVFLGEKWMPMVPAMQILAIYGAVRSIGATTGPVFMGTGKPDLLTKLTSVKLLILVILIYPLTQKLGILGTSLALLVASSVSNPLADYKVMMLIECRLWQFIRLIILPSLSTIAMCGLLLVVRHYFPVNLFVFISNIFLASFIYLIVAVLLGQITGYKVKEIITNVTGNPKLCT